MLHNCVKSKGEERLDSVQLSSVLLIVIPGEHPTGWWQGMTINHHCYLSVTGQDAKSLEQIQEQFGWHIVSTVDGKRD